MLQPRQPRRRALLVGVNYFGQRAELRGCVNDVRSVRRLLVEHYGWPADCICALTDDEEGAMPTRRNISERLRWLAEDARPGDALFFHFSGHGSQQEDPDGFEEDGMNETILPVDFAQAGMLTDDEVGDVIVKPLPDGARLTVLLDCCHSGTGLDLPFHWTGSSWREETNPYHSRGDVLLISGCEDHDCSADVSSLYGAAGGAMTTALCETLRAHPRPSVGELERLLDQRLRRGRFSQRPQFTASQRFDPGRPFELETAAPNANPSLGRTFRRRFPPKPRPLGGSPLADEMLQAGLVCAGAAFLLPGMGNLALGAWAGAAELGGLGAAAMDSEPTEGVASAIGSFFGW